jgi:hypothetical protein
LFNAIEIFILMQCSSAVSAIAHTPALASARFYPEKGDVSAGSRMDRPLH